MLSTFDARSRREPRLTNSQKGVKIGFAHKDDHNLGKYVEETPVVIVSGV